MQDKRYTIVEMLYMQTSRNTVHNKTKQIISTIQTDHY